MEIYNGIEYEVVTTGGGRWSVMRKDIRIVSPIIAIHLMNNGANMAILNDFDGNSEEIMKLLFQGI